MRPVGDIAVLPLRGYLTKSGSPWGSSTITARQRLRELITDSGVGGVLLLVEDSPGADFFGCYELAEELFNAQSTKAIAGHAVDCCGGESYWILSACSHISCNIPGSVGGIGLAEALVDSSEWAKNANIKVHRVSTGSHKGLPYPGAAIPTEYVEHRQKLIDHKYSMMVSGIAKYRSQPIARIRELADGRLYPSAQALANGLIDAVLTFDEAYESLARKVAASKRSTAH